VEVEKLKNTGIAANVALVKKDEAIARLTAQVKAIFDAVKGAEKPKVIVVDSLSSIPWDYTARQKEAKPSGKPVMSYSETMSKRGKNYADPIMSGKKLCRRCGKWKTASPEIFGVATDRWNGLQIWCRDCQHGYHNNRYTGATEEKRSRRHRRSDASPIVNGRKRCTRCKNWKPLIEYYVAKSRVTGKILGRVAQCKRCYYTKKADRLAQG
jgi:hypothetical protein